MCGSRRGQQPRAGTEPVARQVLQELMRAQGDSADPGQPPVLTRRRWGWVAAAAQLGRCCRRRVLGPVGAPLGRPRPCPWRGTGTPLLQEAGNTRGLSTQPPPGSCGRAHPGTLSLAGTWPRGDAGQGDRVGVKDRERGWGLLTAQSSGRHSTELTFGGNPQQVLLQPHVTCVEFGAVDCSHHWVQLPACGQRELVRTGHSLSTVL